MDDANAGRENRIKRKENRRFRIDNPLRHLLKDKRKKAGAYFEDVKES